MFHLFQPYIFSSAHEEDGGSVDPLFIAEAPTYKLAEAMLDLNYGEEWRVNNLHCVRPSPVINWQSSNTWLARTISKSRDHTVIVKIAWANGKTHSLTPASFGVRNSWQSDTGIRKALITREGEVIGTGGSVCVFGEWCSEDFDYERGESYTAIMALYQGRIYQRTGVCQGYPDAPGQSAEAAS
jgi:hypothetical protein